MADPARFYFAARLEDQGVALAQVQALLMTDVPLQCTARWVREGGPNDAPGLWSQRCIQDVKASDVLVLWNPAAIHRTGTGGRHVELGVQVGDEKPAVVLGAAENEFHHHPYVFVFAETTPALEIAMRIYDLATSLRHNGGRFRDGRSHSALGDSWRHA